MCPPAAEISISTLALLIKMGKFHLPKSFLLSSVMNISSHYYLLDTSASQQRSTFVETSRAVGPRIFHVDDYNLWNFYFRSGFQLEQVTVHALVCIFRILSIVVFQVAKHLPKKCASWPQTKFLTSYPVPNSELRVLSRIVSGWICYTWSHLSQAPIFALNSRAKRSKTSCIEYLLPVVRF
jgi:hypothetical protein